MQNAKPTCRGNTVGPNGCLAYPDWGVPPEWDGVPPWVGVRGSWKPDVREATDCAEWVGE